MELEEKGGKTDADKQIEQYDEVNKHIDAIKKNVEKINGLKMQDNRAADDQARQAIIQDLDRMMNDTSKRAREVKDTLDRLKDENKRFESNPENRDSARAQVRSNLYNAAVRRFQTVMTAYNNAREDFKANLQDRLVRQLRIVDSNRSPEEVAQLVESGQAQDIIRKALLSDNLRDTVNDLRDRNDEILKIQRSVQELFELFKDLHTLVEMQGETLNVIENRINTAKDYTEKGKTLLFQAADYQRKARKRKCLLLFCLLGILAAILIPVLVTQFKKA